MRLPSFLIVCLAVLGCHKEPAPLPVLGELDDFTLTDQNGDAFTRSTLDGDVWLVHFFFTSCPSICPPLMDAVRELALHWGEQETGPRFLSISVDGAHDTPQVLRRYAADRDLPLERWSLLTGERAAIVELSESSFRLALASEMDAQGDILHSSRVVLLDRQGRIRDFVDVSDPAEYAGLAQSLRLLLDEPLP